MAQQPRNFWLPRIYIVNDQLFLNGLGRMITLFELIDNFTDHSPSLWRFFTLSFYEIFSVCRGHPHTFIHSCTFCFEKVDSWNRRVVFPTRLEFFRNRADPFMSFFLKLRCSQVIMNFFSLEPGGILIIPINKVYHNSFWLEGLRNLNASVSVMEGSLQN